MSKSDAPKIVTALFSFKGKNNDELCFRKGDVITITQAVDGGWWEGTLNDKTGWFPSNYVKECRAGEGAHGSFKTSPEKINNESPVKDQRLNRDIVLKDLVDSEKANVAELQGLTSNFLQLLELTNILKKEEYRQLIGNIYDVLEAHQRLLSGLESALTQGPDARVGNLFLMMAPRLKGIHMAYCSGHPQAVCILDQYRDELNDFMERSGAVTPGILVLTTGLSKPFRRLEKYSAMLQELERHTEKNHSDRGDTQRSVCVYREISERCASIRKQKELALHVLTGGIKGWEGEELSSLGEILHVGPVTLAAGMERRDRYFVLFPMNLLVLSTSPRMSSFVYEGKLPLTGIDVVATEDTEDVRNAFEISGPMIESIVVLCGNKDDRQQWIELLTQDQSSSLVRSPTMSHVSCTKHPFTRLSKYFARLVRKKVITPELMKKLLYLQYIYKPDLSAVKMRKCTVTYTIYPVNSNNSESSTDSVFVKEKEPQNEKTRSLVKSSIILDVRYAVGCEDLRNLGTEHTHVPLGSSSSLGVVNPKDTDRPPTFDTCKSLPSKVSCASVGTSNLYKFPSSNVLVPTMPLRDNDDDDDNYPESPDCDPTFEHWTTAMKSWKSIEATRRSYEIPNLDYMRTGDSPSQLPTIQESNFDTDTNFGCTSGSSGGIGQLVPITASLHSSDSGMADSYRLNSSDLNSCYKYYPSHRERGARQERISHSDSESDERNFEHQCICSSPFGSTPRNSDRSFQSTESASSSFVACKPASRDDFVENFVSADDVNVEDEIGACAASTTIHLPPKLVFDNANRKRSTQPLPLAHQNVVKRVGRDEIRANRLADSRQQPTKQPEHIYTSGLYAHWWLKKKIPGISGITKQGKLLPWQTSNQSNGKPQQPGVEHCSSPGIKTPWSLASLRPAPPLYSLKIYGKTDPTDSGRTPRTPNERQFEDDAIILKVIEGYCLTVNARFTVHSALLDSEPPYKTRDRVSVMNSRIENWDSCEDRSLSETVKTLKSQITDLQSQMSQLTKQLDEERRSRLLLAAAVKRNIVVPDSVVP